RIAGEARLWEVATGKPLGPMLDLIGAVHTARFSPDGKTFATGAFQLILWDVATSERRWMTPMYGVTRRLEFSPDGRLLLAEHWEANAARLYNTLPGAPTSPHFRHTKPVTQATFSPDGGMILTCSEDRTARLWDSVTGLALGPRWPHATFGWFSPDG